ncbi:hypothetical protein [Streptomyces uncialis]|uniref:Uncharacterized protein n=1 Tax=Streptomyces uncialis TaxID=1048205 RepID=A0A1Q4V964_9ACTN|nr:hypothetical protein [Streptomyces uncialis]MCX4658002.1 hypothetical protein [Streptomyces uncialis]OKH94383.1 hypothetical protein AB852_08650 [Streptomyces uncialis]WST66321.1 hypothetical protein OG268_01570 [Streptomyces uncialis]
MWSLLLPPAYFLLFTPLSLLLRVARDPLRRRWDPSATDYWHYRRPTRDNDEPHPPRALR